MTAPAPARYCQYCGKPDHGSVACETAPGTGYATQGPICCATVRVSGVQFICSLPRGHQDEHRAFQSDIAWQEDGP